ncbi:MAG: histidine phosphatase family protein [Flammeovirgaceae bacterium]
MSVKKIYIIRHGQTDFNLRGVVQGSGVDSHLNDTGRAQADAFFEAYQQVSFDKIYTSRLVRTRESVQQFINKGIPYEMLDGLNEISWGSREGQEISPEEDAYYHWMIEEWQKGNTFQRINGGESPDDVVKRQQVALQHIMRNKWEKTVLICMHGRAMRILLCQLLNYPLRCMDTFEHKNLCLYQLDYTGSMFAVKKHNDISHLSHLQHPTHSELVVSK